MADDMQSTPLDVAGVDTVEIVAERQVMVTLSDSKDAVVRVPWRERDQLEIRREGNRLRIASKELQLGMTQVVLPPSVTTLVLRQAYVRSDAPGIAIELQVSEGVIWSGAAASLRVLDQRRPQTPCRADCARTDIEISGRIAELQVSTRQGKVQLGAADEIGRATLDLGPQARFGIDGARRLDNIHLLGESEDGAEDAIIAAPEETPEP